MQELLDTPSDKVTTILELHDMIGNANRKRHIAHRYRPSIRGVHSFAATWPLRSYVIRERKSRINVTDHRPCHGVRLAYLYLRRTYFLHIYMWLQFICGWCARMTRAFGAVCVKYRRWFSCYRWSSWKVKPHEQLKI